MNAPPVLTPERIDAMLSIMAEVCLGSVVEAGQRQKAVPDDESFERSGRALNQACRNLRQTIALKQRFDREEVAKTREAHAAAEADRKAAERDRHARIEFKRKRVRRHLENLVWDEYDADDADAFCHEVDQRLSDLVYEDDFLDTPLEALIARLADDIGLNDEPETAEAAPEPEVSHTEPAPEEPSPPSQPLAAGPPSLRDPPPAGVDGERVGSGGVSSEPEGSHPHPRPLPARGRGEPVTEPAVAQAASPRPPDPPQPYIPPWERLRPGQRMPGGSGW
ncbi:hypothetical protein [Phenylobacterium sp.]|uniref:hypothetical protein n=1 Tax=Phenylobacterium sp. TaxID=1871053 RepID=UPI003D269343